METERYPQINGSIFSDKSRLPVTVANTGVVYQYREFQELSGLHVPKVNCGHDSEALNPESRLSPDITSPSRSQDTVSANTFSQHNPVSYDSNIDHSSLRRPTQATISISAESHSPSVGAVSKAATASTGSASIPSQSNGTSEVLELEKGVFADPRSPLSTRDRSAWDKIQPRLQDTIDNTLQTRQGLESTISCEFMMGGQSPKQLKPTVFLVCCHEAYRKQLRAILKRQKWMKEYGYQCVVIVDEFEELSYGSLDVSPGVDSISIQASLSNTKTSLCGVLARVQTRPADASVRFTIGGILLIDNKAFGLTVGHVVEKLALPQDGTSDDDDEDDSESSPFITFEEEDTVNITGLSSHEGSIPALEFQDVADSCESTIGRNSESSLEDGRRWSHFGHFHASTTSRSTASCNRLDWSLVSLDPELEHLHHPLINSYEIPTGNRVSINKFLQRSAIIGSDVWINSGSTGMVRGWLMDSLVLFHQHGKTFQVLQVISEKPLAPGDSGSWVLAGNVLCGHVLSSRKSVPWLYVLPIFDILSEIKATMSCQDIVLSQSHRQQGGNSFTNESITSFASGSDTIIADRAEIRLTSQQQAENRILSLQAGSSPLLLPYVSEVMLMTEVFCTCLGSMYLEKANSAPLNYSAYEEHCRSTMGYLKRACGLDKVICLDVLQMIRSGLPKQEIVATMQQRIHCGPDSIQSIGKSVNRIASLLVMIDIDDNYERGYDAKLYRVLWTNGDLEDAISNYFSRQTDLPGMEIPLDSAFTITNLAEIAGLRISWTANLADHLRLDREQRVVHLFHHVTFLECQRNHPQSILPPGLVEETLTTLAILFRSQPNETSPSWLRANSAAFKPSYDASLHAICRLSLGPYQTEPKCFYYWHDRLVVLKRALDESSATHRLTNISHVQHNFIPRHGILVSRLGVVVKLCLIVTIWLAMVVEYRWNSSSIYPPWVNLNQDAFATTIDEGPFTSFHISGPIIPAILLAVMIPGWYTVFCSLDLLGRYVLHNMKDLLWWVAEMVTMASHYLLEYLSKPISQKPRRI